MLISKRNQRRQKSLTIRLRADADTLKGRLIDYLQSHPHGTYEVIEETLLARFSPFILEPNNRKFNSRDEVLQSLAKLQGYCQAIAYRWGIKLEGTSTSTTVGLVQDTPVLSFDDVMDKDVELDEAQAAIHKKFLEDMNSMGL